MQQIMFVAPPNGHPHNHLSKEHIMQGCLSMSADGEVTMIVIPDPYDPSQLLVFVTAVGLAIDPIPLNLADLQTMLKSIVSGK